VIIFATQQYRGRLAKLKYKQPVESFPLFWLKNLLVALVVLAFAWQLANSRGLPVVLILPAALILIYGFISQRTIFGRHIYAIGGNLQAAKLSGVKTRWVNMPRVINMGLHAARAGIRLA